MKTVWCVGDLYFYPKHETSQKVKAIIQIAITFPWKLYLKNEKNNSTTPFLTTMIEHSGEILYEFGPANYLKSSIKSILIVLFQIKIETKS